LNTVVDLFFQEDGKLRCWPSRGNAELRFAVLSRLVGGLEHDRDYSENELTDLLSDRYPFDDILVLRRELVQASLIERSESGGYWRRGKIESLGA
jgi:hypothetical protein